MKKPGISKRDALFDQPSAWLAVAEPGRRHMAASKSVRIPLMAAMAIPIDNISFITPHGPLGLAQVTASPTIGAAATIVFHSSGVKSDLLAIEIASCF